MKLIETVKPVRRSWRGGPLIQTHLPMEDSRVKYVCEQCERPAYTGVRFVRAGTDGGKWLCATCEAGGIRQSLVSRSPERSLNLECQRADDARTAEIT
jgi:hypothetical protein